MNIAPSGYTITFAVKARTIERELRQQRYRTTRCRAFVLPDRRGTGAISVRPVVLTGKSALQEAARGDSAARRPPMFSHIRKVDSSCTPNSSPSGRRRVARLLGRADQSAASVAVRHQTEV